MLMNIAAITKYKHGNIYKLLQKLGWSQSELARRCGMNQTGIGEVINMNRRPSEKLANAIQRAFGEAGEYLDVLEEWPDAFRLEKGFKREEMADVPVGNLLYSKELLALEFESTATPKEISDGIEEAISDLTEQERVAVEDFMDERPSEDTSKKLRVGRQRVHQIQYKALRKLRHPSRIARLNCDKADEIVEEIRQRAIVMEKERKEREEEYERKRQQEMAEKRKLGQLILEKFKVAEAKHPEVFSQIGSIFYAHWSSYSCVENRSRQNLLSGPAKVLEFLRTYVDPEWPMKLDTHVRI